MATVLQTRRFITDFSSEKNPRPRQITSRVLTRDETNASFLLWTSRCISHDETATRSSCKYEAFEEI